MRLPKLVSQFFHRRSKSDTHLILHRAPKPPQAPIRPVSTSFLDNWTLDNEALVTSGAAFMSEILGSISTEPVTLMAPPPTVAPSALCLPAAEAITVNDNLETGPWLAQAFSRESVISLQDPVQELEVNFNSEREANMRLENLVLSLESALKAEREAHLETLEVNKLLSSEVTELQADVINVRGELFAVLKQQLRSSPSGDKDILSIKGENARLRKFASLMVTASAHKPVLELAFRRTLDGEDPEEAVVHAIKDEMDNMGSVWRALLEPIVGQRSPDDYLAQVDCTLKARREARDWRKKARFWKNSAKEGERHAATVTPSVSALSDVVDELPPERQKVVDEMLAKLRNGTLPLKRQTLVRQSSVSTSRSALEGPPISPDPRVVQKRSSRPPSAVVSVPTPLSPITESTTEIEPIPLASLKTAPAPTTTDELPAMTTTPSHSVPSLRPRSVSLPLSVSTYNNLAPLASISFRESHSIKSVKSVSTRRHSIASLRVLTPSASSASQDSQASKKSARRRVKVLAVSVSKKSVDDDVQTSPSNNDLPKTEAEGSPTPVPMESIPVEEAKQDLGSSGQESSRIASLSSSVRSASTTRPSVFNSKRRSSSSTSTSTASSPPTTPIKSFFTSKHSTPFRFSTPTKLRRNTPPSPLSTPPATTTSPSKKSPSKLPVLKMTSIPRSIRRMSISKPVLMDTTNAAASIPEGDGVVFRRKGQNVDMGKVGKMGKDVKSTSVKGTSKQQVLSPKRLGKQVGGLRNVRS
ncbi:unnamed protein product [Somion occarium]|uniref:Uncharacterized protein n=1 Tax=Somion occarium TaxID=3059160 RepID=A0ABP1DNS3_9APHY